MIHCKNLLTVLNYILRDKHQRIRGKFSNEGGGVLEDNAEGDLTIEYIRAVLVADLIIKNENRTWVRYIPPNRKAVKAILSHSRKVDLEPDEWPVMIEIAQRVKDNLPNIRIVPDGKEY